MKIFARQIAPSEQRSCFTYTNYPGIHAWHYNGEVIYCSAIYAEACDAASKVYSVYSTAIKSTKSRQQARIMTTVFITQNYADKFSKPQIKNSTKAWMDAIVKFHTAYINNSDYVNVVLSQFVWQTCKPYRLGPTLTIIMPDDYLDSHLLRNLAVEYYDHGTEWVLHTAGDFPESPEDIEGDVVYCHSDKLDKISVELLEIAGYFGEGSAEVCLFQCTGGSETPTYEKKTLRYIKDKLLTT